MKIPLSIFTAETREFPQHSLIDFYKSPVFLKEYKLEDNQIVALNKV